MDRPCTMSEILSANASDGLESNSIPTPQQPSPSEFRAPRFGSANTISITSQPLQLQLPLTLPSQSTELRSRVTPALAPPLPDPQPGIKVDIQFDDNFQPVGSKGYLEEVKIYVKKLVNASERYKSVCLKTCNMLCKNLKSETKTNFFDKRRGDPNLLHHISPHVVDEQWPELVAYWSSGVSEKISKRNSNNREQRGSVHNTSRKSFAQLRYEKCYADRLNEEPEDQRHLKVVKDRVFHEIMGEDSHGYCHTFGNSVSPSMVYPGDPFSSSSSSSFIDKLTESFKEVVRKEVASLHARIDTMENRNKRESDACGQGISDVTSVHNLERESIGEEPIPSHEENIAINIRRN